MKRLLYIFAATVIVLTALFAAAETAPAQRRATPVNTPATRTQPLKDAEADSIRALEARRKRSTQYTDDNGVIVMVDTLTGVEWTDSTLLPKAPPMKYPLLHDVTAGINLWDPVMRLFGQHYGGASAWVSLSLHNRYNPVFEFGMSGAKNTPDNNNYTYHGKVSPFFKIGMDYNFLYNSNPDYRFFAGVRYGCSPFRFSVDNVTIRDNYWGEDAAFSIPSTSVFAGWAEIRLGLRVKIWGPISAGWMIHYHALLHRTHPAVGDAWYIPGYGTENTSISGSFSISYTLPLNKGKKTPPPTEKETEQPPTSIFSVPSTQPGDYPIYPEQ
ncbi:MAG: DUF6048 family protein [Muribaculaceae bacterium]